MENASKALIIAGAILISILLIGVSMMIFNGAGGLFNNATATMSKQEIQAFNSQWTQYEGKQTGSSVRSLMSELMTNASDKVNGGDQTKLPTVKLGNDTAEFSKDGSTSEYVKNLTTIRTAVKNTKTYEVVCDTDASSGLVNNITITEVTGNQSGSGSGSGTGNGG